MGCGNCNACSGASPGKCAASGVAGSCGKPRSQVEVQTIAMRLPESLVPNGTTVPVQLNGINPTNGQGWHAHVARIRVYATDAQFTTTTGMAGALSGYQLLGLMKFSLRDDCGHYYLKEVDGRTVRDDAVALNYRLLSDDPTDLPDADATPTREITWDILTGPIDSGGHVDPEGMIPLALLQKSDAFKITILSAVPGAPAGVTFDGFQGASNAVYVILTIVYLPALWIGQDWNVDSYEVATANGRLQYEDRETVHASLRYFPEDTGGQSLSDFTSLTATAGGTDVFEADAATEIAILNYTYAQADPDADLTLLGANAQNPTFALLVAAQKTWAGSAGGPITYKSTRSTHTLNRYLHRTRGCRPQKAYQCGVAAACLPPDAPGVAKTPAAWDSPNNAPAAPRVYSEPARAGIAQQQVDELI